MRRLILGCLLLAGCSTAEITGEGSRVQVTQRANEVPAGCHMVGTIRDVEGGGLHSLEDNRVAAETRLRNEAGRLGGNSIAVIDEARGDTDLGVLQFASGVQGMTTPNAGCTNCVALTAHVFQCDGGGAPVADARPVTTGDTPVPPAPRPPADGCERPRAPAVPRPPPPPAPPPVLMPAPAVTVIILPPPQVFMPPGYQPQPQPQPPEPPQRSDDPER
jgi:Domain of unknown function (DUF4156)